MKTIKCDKCKRLFKYKEILDNFPGGLEKEEVICPYCGYVNCEIMTSGIIKTEKIDIDNINK